MDDNPLNERVVNIPALQPYLEEPRLRLIQNPNQRNAATARNCALRSASGEWITYLEDDDAYHSTKLEKQLRRARETCLPLGLCGLAYNLAGRRRLRQVTTEYFSGSELLLETTPDTKALFHKNTGAVFFDEGLNAGEDMHLFFQLVSHFRTKTVFNVPEALVEVYPQIGPRVNLNGGALWKASVAIYEQFAHSYGEPAAKVYLMRAQLQRCKFEGGLVDLAKFSAALIRCRGAGDLRLIANTCLFRIPWMRRFVVS